MQVARALHARGLMLPRNDKRGETRWARPNRAVVTETLKNPSYAGAFAYGRTQMRDAAVPGRRASALCSRWSWSAA